MLEFFDAIRAVILPENLIRSRATRMWRDKTEVIIIGTLHWRHISGNKLGPSFFRHLIEIYEPCKIGIEARQLDIDEGLVGLSPIDMTYIWCISQILGVPVFGFDWWSEAEYEASAAVNMSIDFNSPDRNRRIVDNITSELELPGRYLLFSGYSHIGPIKDGLLEHRFRLDEDFKLCENVIVDSSSSDQVGAMLVPALVHSIKYLDQYLDRLALSGVSNRWTRRVAKKRDRLSHFINVQ